MDIDQSSCSGKSLPRLVQPAVMAILAKEPMHGYMLVRELAGMACFGGQGPDSTGVYRVLKGLESEGFVTSSWELAEHGPARRRFALTAAGKRCLARWIETLHEFQNSVGALLAVATKASSTATDKPANPKGAKKKNAARRS